MQYGHRMTVGILKRLGFGRPAALLKCKLGSVALVVHGVSLFINLAIFQLAGLATNPALRLESGRHHLANLHGKRDGDYHRRQRLTVRRPTKSPGEKLERHRDREKSSLLAILATFRAHLDNNYNNEEDPRMPVILQPDDCDYWLTRDEINQPRTDLLVPYDVHRTSAWPANPKVGNIKNQGPDVLHP